jgi:hypothetical protein
MSCAFGSRNRTRKTFYNQMTGDLADAEFSIPRQIVADVVVFGQATRERDGSISFGIEALTIEE